MSLKDLDLNLITQLVTQQIDHVTCLECCKYYIAPETARCGHSLCHTCWRGRRSCPVCTAAVERRALKPNLPLQMLTDHIHSFRVTFEKLFQIKLDEFMLESQQTSESDPNKNVKQWLASSENQFSAPITMQPSPDSMPLVQLTSSKIQVHTDTDIKSSCAPKVIHKAQPQDDWDKIEELPETEVINLTEKNKENIIGPMDIEPFAFEDEYSTDNPRRSSRKKDHNVETNTKELETNNCKNSSIVSEKKSTKLQQNWGNVKKMRKEFSKLNKKNKSKLNVSIEMVKMTQKLKNKPSPPSTHIELQAPVYDIEENTPNICESENNRKLKEKTDITHVPDIDEIERTGKEDTCAQENKAVCENITPRSRPKTPEMQSQVFKSLKNDHHQKDVSKNSSSVVVMPFIKKGALCVDTKPRLPEEAAINPAKTGEINQPVTVDTDDIEITIKIGNSITNIVISKKNDVQLKVNTDRAIQTSLGPQNLPNKKVNSCSASTEAPIQNLQINIGSNTLTQSKTTSESVENDNAVIVVGGKSTSTKVTKNTASADTATAQFEITESVEREISNIMECVENEEPKITSDKDDTINPEDKLQSLKDAEKIDVEDNNDNEKNNPSAMESLNEHDIFASGSVKEHPVQMLKATKNTLSEIFVTKPKTQRNEKRGREATNEDTQGRKKHKSSQEKQRNANITRDTTLQDSEGMNYDAVMGKVFASIDADIEIIRTSQNTAKNTQVSENTQKANKCPSVESKKPTKTQSSSKKLKTQKSFNNNDKYSENLFTNLDKDSEQDNVKGRTGSKKDPGPETQRNIDNLLTPGVFDNFQSTRDEVVIADDDIEEVMATPVVDDVHDNDDDVVEETPQKSISYTKKNIQAETTNPKPTSIVQPQKTKSDTTKLATKKTLSVINLTDSVVDPKVNDITAIDHKRTTSLETPLNINKFFDHITHKSTPVARKSLNFENDSVDSDRTLCPTSSQLVKNTQEQEFMINAFENTQKTQVNRVSSMTNKSKVVKYCLAGSCLSSTEIARVKLLCSERNWTYVNKFTKELTHLVVAVDEEQKAQRSVKYMCALAASKWIVGFAWVERCLHTQQLLDEEPFEAVDMTGAAGPARSRRAARKLFHGISFYCMPPFSVVNVDDLKTMIESAGGRVVGEARSVRVSGTEPAMLLAEPEHTQEDKFVYMAMELGVVPVNFEWVLNSLGDYCLHSIFELLLCPAGLLPKQTEQWPPELIAKEFDSLTEKQ